MDTLLAFFIGLGSGFLYYFLDFTKLKPWYRKWYGMTHKTPIATENDQSFVYGQPFSGKLYTAVFLTVIITGIIIITGSDNIIVQLLYGVFIIVGLMVSFYLAPLIFRHGPGKFSKLKQTIDKIDDFEAGKLGTEKIEQPERTRLKKTEEHTPAQEEEQDKSEEQDKDKNQDWRKGISDYLND